MKVAPTKAVNIIKVADCDHESIDIERTVLHDVCADLPWLHCRTEDEVVAQCADAVGLLVQYAPMTRGVLSRLPKLRSIVRYGVGVDSIDLAAAAEKGIIVSNVPDYGTDEVSDHALALLLALTRRIVVANRSVRDGVWDYSALLPAHRLRTLTLGIVGLGRIGTALAAKAQALGLTIIASDPYRAADGIPASVRMVDLAELLAISDLVSVHCPLTDETVNLLGEDAIRKMKRSACLVNTARGRIVDEGALDRALSEGRLAGAALDVFGNEPVSPDHPLLRHENFLCTPHMAWYSEESALELKRKAAEELRRLVLNETPLYRVGQARV